MSKKTKRKFFSGHNFTPFVKHKRAENIEFILPNNIYNKMLMYAQCSPGEISGLGKIAIEMKDGKEVATVVDVKIFKQKITNVHTTLDEEGLSRLLYELVKQDEDPHKWNLWWHSHYNFGVIFSGEDVSTIAHLSKTLTWFSLCINQRGDMIARKDAAGEYIGELTIKQGFEGNECYKQIQKEVNELVTIETFPVYGVLYGHHGEFNYVPEAVGDHSPSQFQKSDNYLDRLRRDREFHGVDTW